VVPTYAFRLTGSKLLIAVDASVAGKLVRNNPIDWELSSMTD